MPRRSDQITRHPAGTAATELPASDLRPSKTRRKSEAHEAQALGQALLDVANQRLATLGLDAALVEAIREHRRIKSHEARRRHLQWIGKLMRSADLDVVRGAVAEVQIDQARDSLALHRAEHERAQLVVDDAAVTRFAAAHPDADVQRLRALVRNARKEPSAAPEKRSGRAYRELFRFIREQESHDD